MKQKAGRGKKSLCKMNRSEVRKKVKIQAERMLCFAEVERRSVPVERIGRSNTERGGGRRPAEDVGERNVSSRRWW